jgi:hypothetical protein
MKMTKDVVKSSWVRIAGAVEGARAMQRALGWGLMVGAVAISRPAAAQGPDDPAVRDAQARFEEGLERVKAGDYEGARVSFAQAYAALKRPAILWNLALAEEKTGHLVEALSHFKRVERDKSATASDRDEAQRHAAALTGRTGHVDVQAPPGATFHVDGDATENVTPLAEPVDVTPGHHMVDVHLGAALRSLAFDAPAGQVVRVTLSSSDLAVVAGAPPVAPTSAPSAVPAGAEGPAPPALESPPVGSPQVSTARVVTVTALGGLAVVSAGLGVFLALKSQDDDKTAGGYRMRLGPGHSYCVGTAGSSVDCSGLNHAVHSQDVEALWSNVLYVTAGVLAAGAVVTWFVWPKSKHTEGAWIAPIVGPGTYGLSLGAHF